MGESANHLALVKGIVTWVHSAFVNQSDGLFVLVDSPDYPRERKPWHVSGFVPDVWAGTFPVSFALLGEAKCFGDLETKHTANQLRAFLRYLETQATPHFVLATPPALSLTARGIVRRAARHVGAHRVSIHIICPVELE